MGVMETESPTPDIPNDLLAGEFLAHDSKRRGWKPKSKALQKWTLVAPWSFFVLNLYRGRLYVSATSDENDVL